MDATLPPIGDSSKRPRASPTRRTSPPPGSLARALVKAGARGRNIDYAVAIVLSIGLFFGLGRLVEDLTGIAPGPDSATGIWISAVLAIVAFMAFVSLQAFMWPLFMSRRDRAATIVQIWPGARQMRRVFGTAEAGVRVPTTLMEANRWLAADGGDVSLDLVRTEALVLARRFDEARIVAARWPRGTAFEAFMADMADALIADQSGEGDLDLEALHQAVAGVPHGPERTEAACELAVFEARRLVGIGDWHAPLLAVRPQVPGSDWAIFSRDLAWPALMVSFKTMLPWFILGMFVLGASVIVLIERF
jgi:hypothetical protein